jgi:hypothetical protein
MMIVGSAETAIVVNKLVMKASKIRTPPIVGVCRFDACRASSVAESLAIRSRNRNLSRRMTNGPTTTETTIAMAAANNGCCSNPKLMEA